MDAEEIQSLQGFQCCLRHPDGAGIAFRQAMVALVTPLPDAVVGGAIGPCHVEHEVLDEIRFIAAVDHGAAAPRQLGQLQEEQ